MKAGERFELVQRNGRDFRVYQDSTNTWVVPFDSRKGLDWSGFRAVAALCDSNGNKVCDVTCSIAKRGPSPGKRGRAIAFSIPDTVAAAIKVASGYWDCRIQNGAVTRTVIPKSLWELARGAQRVA